jgi:hypothetical protein
MDLPDGPPERLCSRDQRVCSCLATKARSVQAIFSDEKYSADPVRRHPHFGALGPMITHS